MKKNLHCRYSERVIENSFDSSNWSGYNEDERYNHQFYLSDKQNTWHFEREIEIEENKPVFLLYVLYYDGGTFGRTLGCVDIIEVGHDYDSMNKKFDLINNNPNGVTAKQLFPDDKYGYIPWQGYFAGFQSVHLVQLTESKERHS